MKDAWEEGYKAGASGLTYADNPYEEPKDTPWAFGCSEGMKRRNERAFMAIIKRVDE